MTEVPERKRGRKPVQIDPEQLEKLCALHCTDEDIAGWFGVSVRTIEKRRKQPDFAALMQRGRAKGRVSVRRHQMKLLEDGSNSMAMWLGKHLLGQRDGGPIEHAGSAGGPIQPPPKLDLSRLTDAEIDQLRGLLVKLQSEPAAAAAPDTTTDEEKAA